MPNLNSCSLNSGVAWIFCNSAASRATIVARRAAGATMPCHACQSKPGTVAAIGGTAGSSVVCFAAEVPSAIDLARLDVRHRDGRVGEHHLDLSRQQIGERRRRALVRDVLDVEPVFGLQRFHEQVVRAAAADRRVVVLARIRA